MSDRKERDEWDRLREQLISKADRANLNPPPAPTSKASLTSLILKGILVGLMAIAVLALSWSAAAGGFMLIAMGLEKAWPGLGLLGFFDLILFVVGLSITLGLYRGAAAAGRQT